MVTEAKVVEIHKLKMLAKEKMFINKDDLHNVFYKSLKIKNKQSRINMLKRPHGHKPKQDG